MVFCRRTIDGEARISIFFSREFHRAAQFIEKKREREKRNLERVGIVFVLYCFISNLFSFRTIFCSSVKSVYIDVHICTNCSFEIFTDDTVYITLRESLRRDPWRYRVVLYVAEVAIVSSPIGARHVRRFRSFNC